MPLIRFIDERKTPQPFIVTWVGEPDIIKETSIYFKDYLHVPGQHLLEKRKGPFFESLRKKCMIGVSKCFLRSFPCPIPVNLMLIDKEPHELRHGNGGVCVVQLCCKFFINCIWRIPCKPVNAYHILQRAGDKEILLRKPELLANSRFIIGIEDL